MNEDDDDDPFFFSRWPMQVRIWLAAVKRPPHLQPCAKRTATSPDHQPTLRHRITPLRRAARARPPAARAIKPSERLQPSICRTVAVLPQPRAQPSAPAFAISRAQDGQAGLPASLSRRRLVVHGRRHQLPPLRRRRRHHLSFAARATSRVRRPRTFLGGLPDAPGPRAARRGRTLGQQTQRL